MLRALRGQGDVRSQAIRIRSCRGLEEVRIMASEGGGKGLEWIPWWDLCKKQKGIGWRKAGCP